MKIKFNIDDKTALSRWQPVPTKDLAPDWYMSLPPAKDTYGFDEDAIKNIRACVPVEDFLTAGYILPATYEVRVSEKIENFIPKMGITTASTIGNKINDPKKTDEMQGLHPNNAVAIYNENMCPMRSKDKKSLKNYFRFNSEWSIQTPPGYSCLIIQPYYLCRTDISIMPSIVDTDKFNQKIPVVGYLTGEVDEVRFFCGDPLVQIIPFKRDNWEAEFSSTTMLDRSKYYLFNAYKNLFHSKKQFK
jgi:hypothetical protein